MTSEIHFALWLPIVLFMLLLGLAVVPSALLREYPKLR